LTRPSKFRTVVSGHIGPPEFYIFVLLMNPSTDPRGIPPPEPRWILHFCHGAGKRSPKALGKLGAIHESCFI